jgi:hypothetical protein
MSNGDFCELPFELILKISEYLEFSDIWYLGTCSRQSRVLSYQILKSQYQIDLIRPRIINPFGDLIHAAVAYLGRYGLTDSVIENPVLQSVVNHMAVAISDRIPTSETERAHSLEFLLDMTLGILLDHCLFDPTLRKLMQSNITKDGQDINVASQKFDQLISSISDTLADNFTIRSTGVLLVDYLSTLHETLSILFDEESFVEIHHQLLKKHLQRLLNSIRNRYQAYHTNYSSFAKATKIKTEPSKDFKLFTLFLCSLAKTDLLSSKDIDGFTQSNINSFFMTRPSDVSFSVDSGFKILLRNHNQNLAIINTVTHEKRPAYYYQWKLWLEETQLRLNVLLDLLRSLIQKNYGNGEPPEFTHTTKMLQETVSALTMTRNTQQLNDNDETTEIPLTENDESL